MGDRQNIRQLFTAATLRTIMNLPRVASDILLIFTGKTNHPNSNPSYRVGKNRQDVLVDFIDTLRGVTGIGRLYIPANILWKAPKNNDSGMAIKPSEADGPGVPYVLIGDSDVAQSVPSWFETGHGGISAKETIHVESLENDVVVQANVKNNLNLPRMQLDKNGAVTLASANNENIALDPGSAAAVVANGVLNVGRVTDAVTGQAGPYPLVNGQIASGTPHLLA